jgi:hypothetical protein
MSVAGMPFVMNRGHLTWGDVGTSTPVGPLLVARRGDFQAPTGLTPASPVPVVSEFVTIRDDFRALTGSAAAALAPAVTS